ncbi:MAG: hypothetical protein WBC40_05375 [Halobacteriota archaeon]
MSLIAKLKGMAEYKKYLKTLGLSTALAFLMLYIAFGLMFFAKGEKAVPKSFIFLILAIFFIFFTVFYQSKGKTKSKSKENLKSLIKGLFLAICATFAFVAVVGGVKFMVYNGLELIGGIGSLISALAICMIVSTVFLTLLTPS